MAKNASKSPTFCSECGAALEGQRRFCSSCGGRVSADGSVQAPHQSRANLSAGGAKSAAGAVAAGGAALLVLGVFAPLIRLPLVGAQNYFQNGQGDGVALLAFAALSLLAILVRRFRALWLTGLASLGLIGYTFIQLQIRLAQMKNELDRELADNPFRGLADLTIGTIRFDWGWAILVIGAVMLLVAAGMDPSRQTP